MADIADKFGKSSIDTDYAIATTVDATRTIGVTVLDAVDLSKFADDTPVFFVTYKKTTNPTTGEVTVVDLVSWKGLVNTGANTLTNLTLAPGYTDIGNDIGDFIECIPTSYWENSLIDGIFVGHNPDGTFKLSALKSALGNDGLLVEALDDLTSDVVVAGGVWAAISGLNAGMTLLTAYIDGYKNTVAAVATRAFTVSKDTYIDVLRNTSTNVFTLVYTEVANGAAAPALAANSLRLAKVVTSGAAVTSVLQRNADSLSNLFRPLGTVRDTQVGATVAFKAYRTANQTLATSAITKIQFNVEDFDLGADYDSATNYQFVAPVSGVYHFEGQLTIDATGSQCLSYIYVNGANVAMDNNYNNAATDDMNSRVSATLFLNAGDTVDYRGHHNAGADRTLLGSLSNTYFSGFLVGRA